MSPVRQLAETLLEPLSGLCDRLLEATRPRRRRKAPGRPDGAIRGRALDWGPKDRQRLSRIAAADKAAGRSLWAEASPEQLKALLDAEAD